MRSIDNIKAGNAILNRKVCFVTVSLFNYASCVNAFLAVLTG